MDQCMKTPKRVWLVYFSLGGGGGGGSVISLHCVDIGFSCWGVNKYSFIQASIIILIAMLYF